MGHYDSSYEYDADEPYCKKYMDEIQRLQAELADLKHDNERLLNNCSGYIERVTVLEEGVSMIKNIPPRHLPADVTKDELWWRKLVSDMLKAIEELEDSV